MRRIKIFDTTLRDGEQAAGGALTIEEKLEIGRQLERLGGDCIEGGFPATSPGGLHPGEALRELVKDRPVAALSDAKLPNIQDTGAAPTKAVPPRLHPLPPTSERH